MTTINATPVDTGSGLRWDRAAAAEPARGLEWAQCRAAQSAARGHPALPRRYLGAGGAAERRRAQLLRRRRHPHLRIQGQRATAVFTRGDGLAAVGDVGTDPAARACCHGGAGVSPPAEAGWALVCASDVVIAAESAKFFSGAVRVGMAPDGGSSVTLTQLVGLRQALRILLLNPTLSAAEAQEIGLVTETVPDDQLSARATEIATTLASSPTLAVSATKRLVWNGVGASVEQRLAEESRTVSELSGTDDALEGLRAVIERRPPKFSGR